MKRVFSGVQPTGVLTIGNYLGAIKQWVEVQDELDCFYCVVDLHAITLPHDPKALRANIEDTAIYLIAAGLNPEKVTIFVQSDVPEHTQLSWIMECTATFGELSRMTQFKDKSEGKETVSGGLFTYPALMAADILLYDSDFVPVGEDQKQHVELCRDVAERFNSRFGPTFKVPEPLIPKTGARVKSLQDPSKKMSKSDANPNAYIALGDTPDVIDKKIRRAVTDSGREIIYSPDEKPTLANLMTIYSGASGKSIQEIESMYAGRGYADFKKDLSSVVVEMLRPIQEKYRQIKSSGAVDQILKQGALKAHRVAEPVLFRAKERAGLSTRVRLVDFGG